MATTNDPESLVRVALQQTQSLLEGERQCRILAEEAWQAARGALLHVGQVLTGNFREVYKDRLPHMSETEIGDLLAQEIQNWRRRQSLLAAPHPPAAPAPAPAAAPRAATSRRPAPPPPPPPEDAPPAMWEEDAATEAATTPVLEITAWQSYSDTLAPAAAESTWPGWFGAWWAKHDSSDYTVLQILGRTGHPYRVVVAATAAALLTQQPRSGNIERGIKRLLEHELLTYQEVTWGYIKPHLVALTAQGQDAYRLLFGAEPAAQLLPQLLALHKSALHVYLILETQRALEAAGFQVALFPAGVSTDMGLYLPDLTATFEGHTLYIEAETTATHANADRAAKWQRYWEVTQGQFYCTVPNAASKRKLLSDLRHWALDQKRNVDVWVVELGRSISRSGWEFWKDPIHVRGKK